jgi:hypothetical protein
MLDRTKLHKGFQTYLANAEAASEKTWDDFARILSASGLTKHGELRSHLMDKAGLGHGHANAVVAIWLQVAGAATPKMAVARKATPAKAAKKAPAKKK